MLDGLSDFGPVGLHESPRHPRFAPQSVRKSFNGTFIPDASTLERYCCHDPATRIYRTDQDDETAATLTSAPPIESLE